MDELALWTETTGEVNDIQYKISHDPSSVADSPSWTVPGIVLSI